MKSCLFVCLFSIVMTFFVDVLMIESVLQLNIVGKCIFFIISIIAASTRQLIEVKMYAFSIEINQKRKNTSAS